MQTLVKQIRGFFILGVVIVVLIGIAQWPGFDTDVEETPFGPRRTGLDPRTGCRFMSIDVEATTNPKERTADNVAFPAILDAHLGPPSKPIVNQHIVIPDFSRSRQYFKHEFCSMPGSALNATVRLTGEAMVAGLSCYFYEGADADADNATQQYDMGFRAGGLIGSTWCRGVVPP